jgi:hypothetical protein
MSAYFIVLQEDVDDVDAFVALKTITKARDKLAEIAEEIGVSSLESFVHGNDRGRDDFEDIAENEGWGGIDYQTSAGTEEWFEPNDGLDSVRALIGYIESDPECLKRPKATLEELRGMETVLESAMQAGVKFRLEEDE